MFDPADEELNKVLEYLDKLADMYEDRSFKTTEYHEDLLICNTLRTLTELLSQGEHHNGNKNKDERKAVVAEEVPRTRNKSN